MSRVKLLPFQKEVLADTQGMNRVAYYLDMGLGKTFVGSEKLEQLGAKVNLVVCQKSKIDDWFNHFVSYYQPWYRILDLTDVDRLCEFQERCIKHPERETKGVIGIINYDLLWRRPKLRRLEDFTLLLDESSLIQHETTKRAKFILGMKPQNVILLSGTPCNGTYETLWSQLQLLNWNIKKWDYWNTYVDYEIDRSQGFPLITVHGYKRVDRLKEKLYQHGCRFMRTDEVIDLPEQTFIYNKCRVTEDYRTFRKDSYMKFDDGVELIGDNPLTRLLHQRQLCGIYNTEKHRALKDLLESTSGRIVVFYNFHAELEILKDIADELKRPYGIFNGEVKLTEAYTDYENGILFIQYQAGAYGLNLQQGNRIIYFTPPLSSEVFEQSKKRIHRIGQTGTCYYHLMIAKGSVEERIYWNLERKRDYTQALFEKDELEGY